MISFKNSIMLKLKFGLLTLCFLVNIVLAVPVDSPVESEDVSEDYEIIDQRQNGTENYRIDVKDVILVWAPPEALLAAATILEHDSFGSGLDFNNIDHKKPQVIESNQEYPAAELNVTKPDKIRRNKIRIPAFMVPLLRKKTQ